ncbi:MAG: membrane protein insertase YidC [Prevotellaceae bacterium]|jgi:YidC/Oxa1 family membrane protein insertase|nr:membrane protein insertase YidC [Prevotellaceae bacterium]
MDRNTLYGFLAIGAILIGFSYYTSKQSENYALEKHRLDSIAAVKIAAETAATTIATAATAAATTTTAASGEAAAKAPSILPVSESLAQAAKGEQQFYTIENDLIAVTLTNQGGRVYSVELKNYHAYNSKPLVLFDGNKNDFALTFYTNDSRNFTTSDFYFSPQTAISSYRLAADDTAYTFALRLQVGEGQLVDYEYTLRNGSYMVDFNLKMVGLRNVTNADLLWSYNAFQQEKAFDNENNYSTVAYSYPGEDDIEELGQGSGNKEENVKTRLQWIAFKQQFFSSILLAKGDNFYGAYMGYITYKPNNRENFLKQYVANIQLPVAGVHDQNVPMAFYFGPNHYSTLKSSFDEGNFHKLVPLGGWVIGWINRLVVIPIFDLLGKYISSYGLIILILTVLIKVVLFPLTFKSYLSSAKMRLLKPDVDRIAHKYPKKEDAMKKQQETMALYKKAGASPMGGCLPILVQFPILIAMFRFFPASIELRQQPFLWADDLSGFDSILNLPFTIPFYGDHISLFTLLMAAALFVSSRMSMSQTPDTGMPGMKFMTLYLMPAMMLFWFNSYAAGLSYYYFLSNLITIGQNFATRRMVNEVKLHARMKENSKKPVKKSRFQAKLEDMARMQQQQQRGRR